MDMNLEIDISRAKAAAVGAAHGIGPDELEALAPRVREAHHILQDEREQGKYGFYDLYKDTEAVAKVKAGAEKVRGMGFDNLVVLGIGGSALGITALHTALCPPYHNLLTRGGRKGAPRLFVMDNIDPMTFRAMMRLCPPKKTFYNVISKSGGTAETMSQLMIILEQLEKKLGPEAIRDHVAVTTSPKGENAPKSLLHPVADAYGLDSYDIPLNVGGRFSVFSPVGLLPAAILGMDVDGLLEGCAAMDRRCSQAELEENPAYLRAALHYLADTEKGKKIAVMMPYADGLRHIAAWYCQLWAESLGKRYDLQGNEVFAGSTPLGALGATDQHSQVQLFREGPNDKLFTVLEVKKFDRTLKIPPVLGDIADLDYLRGKSMNKLMAAEFKGTVDALKLSKRPVVKISLPRLNAHTIGQLLYMLEVETAMAGRLYNVNTFDQPGVEDGKIIARKLMGGGG